MRTHVLRLMIISVCVLDLLGCGSMRTYPGGGLQRTAFPSTASLSDAEVRSLLDQPLGLTPPLRGSLLWVDENSGFIDAALPESERSRLLEHFVTALSQPPFDTVSVIPTTAAATREEPLSLSALRSVGAHFQSDLVIVLTTRANTYDDWNLLALTYLALVPALLMPGENLAVYTSAEACALDVRSGIFIACAQGRGTAMRNWVTPPRREQQARTLGVAAAEDAIRDIPRDLVAGVWARVAHGRSDTRGLPTGSPYTTRSR